MKHTLKTTSLGTLVTLFVLNAFAHVPFIEGKDYAEFKPFPVQNITQSKAFYAYLEQDEADSFVMEIDKPTRIYVNTLIPFCREYAKYDVNYALTGPGLPQPDVDVPFDLPAGHGAVVYEPQYSDWSGRPFMYEQYSDRRYFEGSNYTYEAQESGTYKLFVWHASGIPGDYIAVIGRAEQWGSEDVKLAAINTPIIQDRAEMRSNCESEGDFSKWFEDESFLSAESR